MPKGIVGVQLRIRMRRLLGSTLPSAGQLAERRERQGIPSRSHSDTKERETEKRMFALATGNPSGKQRRIPRRKADGERLKSHNKRGTTSIARLNGKQTDGAPGIAIRNHRASLPRASDPVCHGQILPQACAIHLHIVITLANFTQTASTSKQ
ncbi:hypothetical protein AOLI_G00092950 [Acnodon oligacanthus]